MSKPLAVAIIGLSCPLVDQKRTQGMQNLVDFLRLLQHKVTIFPTAKSKSSGYFTAPIIERVADLEKALCDEKIDVVLNLTGGYNANELLEFVNFKKIQNAHSSQTIFVGYSDITTFNLALTQQCPRVKVVHGPMAVDYTWNPEQWAEFLSLLFRIKNQATASLVLANWETQWGNDKILFRSGKICTLKNKQSRANGALVAANLSTFNLMLGTPFLPNLKKKILFLEYDKEETSALPSIQRMLWQARQNKIFNNISGLVFGMLTPDVANEEKPTWGISEVLAEVTNGYSFPVLFNTQFGHMYPSWSLPFGWNVELNGTTITLTSCYT